MMGPIGIIIRESNRNMAEIKSRIKNSKQKIENLNEEVRQETNYLAFLRRLEKAEEDLGEAEKIKNENAKQISILTAKVSSYEKKLKTRDSLLKKMDTKMNEMKNENAADISDLIYFYESSMKGGWLLLSFFFYFGRENSVYSLEIQFKACRIRCKKKFGACVNEFTASEAANWAGSQESRGSSKNQIKTPYTAL